MIGVGPPPVAAGFDEPQPVAASVGPKIATNVAPRMDRMVPFTVRY